MKQKMVIEVESTKPLSSYGSSHIIVYDSKKGYYATTREAFLRPQNEKIEQLEAMFSELEKSYTQAYNGMVQKYNDFLRTYKETNGKMIEMIKALQKGGKE